MDYRKTAQEIYDHIGKKENIISAAHCATRLRLVIGDNSKADKEYVENIEGVKGVFFAQGQMQIILGTGVVNKAEGTRTFGVRFYEDEDKAESYQFVFNVTEDRYVFEKKPNWPWPANQNIGLERPLELVPGKKYNIKMIVDDTIATIYVDGVALNARAYKRPGESLSLFASEGSLKVTNCKVTTGLKK